MSSPDPGVDDSPPLGTVSAVSATSAPDRAGPAAVDRSYASAAEEDEVRVATCRCVYCAHTTLSLAGVGWGPRPC